MKILLSNDDGYLAPGLACLADALGDAGEVVVVAPDRDRSGASNSLTLRAPLRVKRATDSGFYYVNGTPTDCVHLAVTGLMEKEPDMVIAGINNGSNLGDDTLYSGTVAAAIEGRFLGYPAIAISLVDRATHYDTAGYVAQKLLQRIRSEALPADTILNVNVPDVPTEHLAGFQATRLGNRHKSEPVITDRDPQDELVYWIGPAGPEQDAGPGTDFHAVKNGYVSITPLHTDLTQHTALLTVTTWLNELPDG